MSENKYSLPPCGLPCFPKFSILNSHLSATIFIQLDFFWGGGAGRQPGLFSRQASSNLGTQCYMNSIHQECYSFSEVRKSVLSDQTTEGSSPESAWKAVLLKSIISRPATLAYPCKNTQADSWDPLQTHWIRGSGIWQGNAHFQYTAQVHLIILYWANIY